MKIVDRSSYIMSADLTPCAYADPGEEVVFRSKDAFGGIIVSEEQLVGDMPLDESNPCAGPLYINGAKPGDVLAVDILDIRIADSGVICTCPDWGPLCDHMEECTAILPIVDGKVQFRSVEIPVAPMVGTIGTAPAEGKTVASGYPGTHGGNYDSTVICPGSRVYFPVFAEGALLQMGDLHAVMGDGELCGAALEVAGDTHVKTEIIPQFPLNWPVSVDRNGWYVHACAPTFEQALKNACVELQRLLMDAWGLDETDAYFYISMQGSAAADQCCTNPCDCDVTVRVRIPLRADMPPLIP